MSNKIFIDTNVYLSFYKSNTDAITIFENDLSKLKSSLIMTDQVYDEFIRNRDNKLAHLPTRFKNDMVCKTFSTSIFKDTNEFKKLDEIKKEFDKTTKKLIKKIKDIEKNPDKDPVYKSFLKLYKNDEVTTYQKNEGIIKKAQVRNLLGNPPGPKNSGECKHTIGDEVIWETLLEFSKDDLMIISEDSTYNDYNAFLRDEYKEHTGKKLTFSNKISAGLKKLGEKPSKDLGVFEKEEKRVLSVDPSFNLADRSMNRISDKISWNRKTSSLFEF